MKQFIKWLAHISGIEKEIRHNERDRARKDIAGTLIDASYWFTPEQYDRVLFPLLYRMGHFLKGGYSFHGDTWRKQHDELKAGRVTKDSPIL